MRIGRRVSLSVCGGTSMRSTRTSLGLRLPAASGTTSICTPFWRAMRACSSAWPMFSLPSLMSTMRLAVPSGKDARASLMAEAMSV